MLKNKIFICVLDERQKNNYTDITPEENFVQPKLRGGFSDLIKKVMGNGESKREEYVEPTLVEALFEARNGKKRATPFWEEDNVNPENDLSSNKVEESKNDDEAEVETTSFGFVKETYDDENIMQKIKENNSNNDETQEIKFAFRNDSGIFAKDTSSEIKNISNDFELKQSETSISENDEIKENEIDEKIEVNEEKIINETEEKLKNVIEKDDVVEDENGDDKTVQIGNVTISSDTAELSENINDYLNRGKNQGKDNNEIREIEETPLNFVNESTIIENVEEIKEELPKETYNAEPIVSEEKTENKEFDDIAESIVKNKIEKSMEPTQILDMNKIRENIAEIEEKDEKEVTPEFAEMYKKTFGKDISKRTEEKIDNLESYNDFLYSDAKENLNMFDYENNYVPERKFRYVGKVFECYLIIEMNAEMYVIDQRLAYERIIYEKLKESYYDENCRDSQILLLPDIIALNRKQIQIANENIEMFVRAGFGFEDFGENTLKLYAVPGLCEKLNTKQLFLEILDGLDSVSIISKEEKEEKFISTIAYKSAAKAKLNLDENEIKDVLNQLLSLKDPFVCADEKQIAIKMSKIDFEKKFSRR